tara:strand:+ start:9588 stop:9920 length:333 start_codon:yes stop_codon:yes gene_type:complete
MLDQLQLTPSETKEFISDNDALLLDVRTPEEFAIVNLSHIGNHLHLPMDALSQNLAQIDKDKKIVIYCHHGVRSLHVQHFLLQNGYDQVYNLIGGIDAWTNEVEPELTRY